MNPITAILGLLVPVINKFIPDPQEQLRLQNEITTALINQQGDIMKAMASVMAADAASEGWLTRNARPFCVFWSLGMISYVGIVAPWFGIQTVTVEALTKVPSELWQLMQIGIGGYLLVKGAEKIVDTIKSKPAG